MGSTSQPMDAVFSMMCARAVSSSRTSYADTRAAGVACRACTHPKGSYGPFAPECRIQQHAGNRSNYCIPIVCARHIGISADIGIPRCRRPNRGEALMTYNRVLSSLMRLSTQSTWNTFLNFILRNVFPSGQLTVPRKFVPRTRQLCILTAHTWPRNTGRRQRHCDSAPSEAGTQQTRTSYTMLYQGGICEVP